MASTAIYYEHINRGSPSGLAGCTARASLESLDFAPYAAMQMSGDWDGVAGVELEAANRLEASGAEGLISPRTPGTWSMMRSRRSSACRCSISPMATADRLVADGRKRVALLGTRFTMTEAYIRSRLEAPRNRLAPIDAGWIREIDRIIFDELAAGRVIRDSQRKLKTLITELAKQKVQAVVLGCTELVLAVDVRANVLPVYDTTALHARACVDWMLADEEEARAAA